MFKIGDKVRLKKEEVDYYWNNPDEGWSDDAHETFQRGRVFTVTRYENEYRMEIDNGRGGRWPADCFVLNDFFEEDLFNVE